MISRGLAQSHRFGRNFGVLSVSLSPLQEIIFDSLAPIGCRMTSSNRPR